MLQKIALVKKNMLNLIRKKKPRQFSGSWPSGTCFWVRGHVLEQSENLTSKMLRMFPNLLSTKIRFVYQIIFF